MMQELKRRLSVNMDQQQSRTLKKYYKFASMFLNHEQRDSLYRHMRQKQLLRLKDNEEGLNYEAIPRKKVDELVRMFGPNLDMASTYHKRLHM